MNPILLKHLDAETVKELYHELTKKQGEIRAEKFPAHDMHGIRWRNLRLQRLHTAAMVIRNYAKARKISII